MTRPLTREEDAIHRAMMHAFKSASIGDAHVIHDFFKRCGGWQLKEFYVTYNWPLPRYR